ncbi:hypothetical protein NE562_05580, partial [Butyricicoccus faecihominis]|uniref:hypothetical protein n=1 Tax=Butyricicoccus faecihominis TaxID=1712515 RepID=UPI0024797DF8
MAGKVSGRRTETTYKAVQGRTSLLNKTKSNATRILHGKCGGSMKRRLLFLPGEVLQTESKEKNPKSAVTTNCKKSAEAIVPKVFFREGPNNRKSLVQAER